MSLGYAEKLSYREDLGGQLGAKELFDKPSDLRGKVHQLKDLILASDNIVVFTGAGISTSCGIPDFRGPKGVWTLQRAGKRLPKPKTTFTLAQPSLTHMVLEALVRSGKVKMIVSQNVDGLHLRSGVPRTQLAELHGNCFAERCPKCKKEHIRDFEIETVGFKETGRLCSEEGCSGRLRDHILDWEDALPEDELKASEQAASNADLAICLGTSLQITPACNLPLRTVRAGGKLVIVNLQATPKDSKAHLLLHGRTDKVMRTLMELLRQDIPDCVREDHVAISTCQEASSRAESYPITLSISSVHGASCPLPLVQSVDVRFQSIRSTGRTAVTMVAPRVTLRSQPFLVAHSAPDPGPCRASIVLHLVDAIAERYRTVELVHIFNILPLVEEEEEEEEEDGDLRPGEGRAAKRQRRGEPRGVQRATVTFQTQRVEYREDD